MSVTKRKKKDSGKEMLNMLERRENAIQQIKEREMTRVNGMGYEIYGNEVRDTEYGIC